MEIQDRLRRSELLDEYVIGGHDQPRNFQVKLHEEKQNKYR